MGNVIGSALQDFAAMLHDAITRPGRWSAVAILLVVVFVAGALRSKITASWIFIPVLAVAIYLSVYRWLRLR